MLAVLSVYLHRAIVPEEAADLALQQMNEDGSREKLRMVEQMSNWIDIAVAAAALAGLAAIWGRSLRERFKTRCGLIE